MIDQTRFMEVLNSYGLSPKLRRLLQRFWVDQVVLPKVERYYGRPFKTVRGVTQGYPLSPTVFNIMLNSVIRSVLIELCVPQESHNRIGWETGKRKIILYADDGRIAGIKSKKTLVVIVLMFDRLGLYNILGKTKAVVYTLKFIWEKKWGG